MRVSFLYDYKFSCQSIFVYCSYRKSNILHQARIIIFLHLIHVDRFIVEMIRVKLIIPMGKAQAKTFIFYVFCWRNNRK